MNTEVTGHFSHGKKRKIVNEAKIELCIKTLRTLLCVRDVVTHLRRSVCLPCFLTRVALAMRGSRPLSP